MSVETKVIMFTDRVGSSTGASQSGDAVRGEVQAALDRLTREAVEEHHGTVVKFLGDGHLLTFRSASDALRAGLEIVARCAAHNATAAESHRIHLRVGADTGDVEVDGAGDVRGHAADMAKRVETAAPTDAVACSDRVRELLPPGFGEMDDLGERELKGAPRKIRLFRVVRVPAVAFRNPFLVSRPVSGARDFHGRERELGEIFARMGNGGSTSITGGHRIGKSSLLRQVLAVLPQRLGPAWRGIGLDMANPRVRTVAGALAEIQRALGINPAAAALPEFAERLAAAHAAGLRAVIGFDGMEVFSRLEREFSHDFFEALRAMAGDGHLAVLATSARSLRELHEHGPLLSPLYNIMAVTVLGEFTADEAEGFVARHRPGAVFEAALQRKILTRAGRHPLRLQCYCARAADALQHANPDWDSAWAAAAADVQGMIAG